MDHDFKEMELGIGDWGLGIGDWAQSPIPNPQSPFKSLLFLIFENLTKNFSLSIVSADKK
jgi:hypothetical protein